MALPPYVSSGGPARALALLPPGPLQNPSTTHPSLLPSYHHHPTAAATTRQPPTRQPAASRQLPPKPASQPTAIRAGQPPAKRSRQPSTAASESAASPAALPLIPLRCYFRSAAINRRRRQRRPLQSLRRF
ncbi:uncharacterized protein PSFLO_06937 [Pseudozyma flocculosa]|uniref:Uncharacterized protein n=1 Tax=Pseudozyma flocculosa TaxID=84751 RepID=A0A5C3FCQ6_9BASI|nr:uncharacterized protein PSFLO_06937 [Pseudozyma flocculosa]